LADSLEIAKLGQEYRQGCVMRLDLSMHRGGSRRSQGDLEWRVFKSRHSAQRTFAGVVNVRIADLFSHSL
jgi:hypothetical protein